MASGGDWEGVRLHVVTGKGGTGKTTVAAALALALAGAGGRILVIEVEGRQGIAGVFDVPPLPHAERKVASVPGGGEVYGLAVEPRAAMTEYLDMYYRLGRAARALDRLGAVDFVTTIAPGLRDVLLTGKAYETTKRTHRDGRPMYDAVVLDAPPTGRITRFLNVTSEVAGLARVGPVHRHAESTTTLLHSPRTAVHLVTLLEEMPVQETVDAAAELRETGLPVGAVIVNQVRRPALRVRDLAAARKGTLDADAVSASLAKAGLPSDEDTVAGLFEEAREHAERVTLQKQVRAQLDKLSRPTYDLTHVAGGMTPAGLHELAAELRAQGAA